MKLEKLEYGKSKGFKMFLYGFLMCATLILLINLFTSKAKYKQVDNVELIRQNITYSAPDLNIIGVFVKDENGLYQKQTKIPDTGVILDKGESYCTIPSSNDKIKGILDFQDGILMVNITQRNTKCYLYFEEILSEKTLKKLGLTSLGNIGNKFTEGSTRW